MSFTLKQRTGRKHKLNLISCMNQTYQKRLVGGFIQSLYIKKL